MGFAKRAHVEWKLRTRTLPLGVRTLVMGVLNVTPDSFSEGGAFREPAVAAEHALAMFAAGAEMVDIGGESTRPGARGPLSADEEIDRVLPVMEEVLRARPGSLLSIDTYHAETARAAVTAGAEIVNDVSGFLWDEAMARTCGELGCGVVLMHTRGRPEEWRRLPRLAAAEVLPLVKRELGERLKFALNEGIERERIALDPGYGFGKSFEANYPLLAAQEELLTLGQPLLAGISRKSFLARTLAPLHGGEDAPMNARGNATLAATVAAVLAGASIVRVHEVRPAVEACLIADAILAGG